jgi:type I restriction enzyme S subunit
MDVQPGFACGSHNRQGVGIPHLRPMNVSDEGRFDLSDVKFVPREEVDRDERLIRAGDVLFNNTNSPALVGKTACYADDAPRAFSNHMTRVRCRRDVIDSKFCAMILHQKWKEGYFESVCNNHVSQASVSRGVLLETPIHLPPPAEQKRIVAKVEELLARVNAARERLARVPARLKRFRQAVLAACSGRLTENWREEQTDLEPAQDSLEGPEKLPDSWAWATFGDLIGELRNGISTKPNPEPPGHPILRISSTRPGRVLLDDIRYLPDADDLVEVYGLRDGDLLFTRYNGSLDLLGVCGMVRGLGKRTLLYPDKLMRVRIGHGELLPDYVEAFFGSPQARDRIEAKSKSSAGQQGVSGADIKRQPIAVPPLAEQREIVRRVEALFKLADAIEKRVAAATARADKLTQAILAKAFRGELVPTEAELARFEGRDYEPASALLERIRAERAAVSASPSRRRASRRKS